MNTSVSGKCILVLPLCTRILCFNKFQIDEGHCAKNVLVLTCPNFFLEKKVCSTKLFHILKCLETTTTFRFSSNGIFTQYYRHVWSEMSCNAFYKFFPKFGIKANSQLIANPPLPSIVNWKAYNTEFLLSLINWNCFTKDIWSTNCHSNVSK